MKQKKTAAIVIAVEPSLRKKIISAVEKDGRSISGWIRFRITEYFERVEKEAKDNEAVA